MNSKANQFDNGNFARLSRIALVLLAMVFVDSCGGGGSSGGNGGGSTPPPPPPPPVVSKVSVSPPSPTLTVGETMQMNAIATDSAGQTITGRTVSWTTEDDSKAAVSASGLVTAVAIGSTRVSAQIDNRWGFSTVTVIASVPPPDAVASVQIMPDTATVNEGANEQFRAVARSASGRVITGRGSHWSVQDALVSTIDGSGRITALRPGMTTVTVRIDGQSATANLRVQANYAFELLYDTAAAGISPSIYSLDITDPAAVAMQIAAPVDGAQDASASANGNRIAYAERRPGGTVIMVANRDGSNPVQLSAEGATGDQPVWSPDGTRIAYRNRPIGSGTDIWVMNSTNGANKINLTASHGATNQASPAWSPIQGDGSYRIAYSHAEGGRAHIWTMRADGTDKTQVTSAATVFDDQPDWSPDGARIVFVRAGTAIFGDLYIVNASGGDGGLLMQLAGPLAGPQREPAWSPDGQLIAFASRHTGEHFQVYTVWFDGTRLATRTSEPIDHASPAWLATAVTAF